MGSCNDVAKFDAFDVAPCYFTKFKKWPSKGLEALLVSDFKEETSEYTRETLRLRRRIMRSQTAIYLYVNTFEKGIVTKFMKMKLLQMHYYPLELF